MAVAVGDWRTRPAQALGESPNTAPRGAELRFQGPPPSAKNTPRAEPGGEPRVNLPAAGVAGRPRSRRVEQMSELSLSRFRRCFCSKLRLGGWHPHGEAFRSDVARGSQRNLLKIVPKTRDFTVVFVPFFGHFRPDFICVRLISSLTIRGKHSSSMRPVDRQSKIPRHRQMGQGPRRPRKVQAPEPQFCPNPLRRRGGGTAQGRMSRDVAASTIHVHAQGTLTALVGAFVSRRPCMNPLPCPNLPRN
jgi:hypothetical protein